MSGTLRVVVMLKSSLRTYNDIASYSDLFLLNVAKILVVIRRGRPAHSSALTNTEVFSEFATVTAAEAPPATIASTSCSLEAIVVGLCPQTLPFVP